MHRSYPLRHGARRDHHPMTWTKLGAEFFDELTDFEFPDDLDDACQLTHTQAIHFVYSTENADVSFPRKRLRRFATSSQAEAAAQALIAAGAWEMDGDRVRIIAHRNVVRQSLGFQQSKREKDRERQQKHRSAKAAKAPDVTPDVTRDVAATQSVSQSGSPDKQASRGNSNVSSFFDRVEQAS